MPDFVAKVFLPFASQRRIIPIDPAETDWWCRMPLTLSDEDLEKAGMTADQARVEFACRLFDAGKLDLWPAAQLAKMTRVQFEGELMERLIAIHRPTLADLQSDLETIEYLRAMR